jgi:hypothetical protein
MQIDREIVEQALEALHLAGQELLEQQLHKDCCESWTQYCVQHAYMSLLREFSKEKVSNFFKQKENV